MEPLQSENLWVRSSCITAIKRLFAGVGVAGLLIVPGPATAQDGDLSWQFNEFRSSETRRMTATLVYGVPETDNVRVRGVCEARSGTSVSSSSLIFSTDVGGLKNGTSASLLFSGGGFSRLIAGTVEGVGNTEERIAGVRLDVPHDDPVWTALQTKSGLDYFIPGYRANTLGLKGASRAIRKFVDTCRAYAEGVGTNAPDETSGNSGSGGSISEKEAFDIARDLNTTGAWTAFLKTFPNGFRAELAREFLKRAQAGGSSGGGVTNNGTQPSAKPSTSPQVERLPIRPKIIRVGRWPEGIAYDGRSLWVAESGRRSIAEVNPRTGQRRRVRRMSVGRLPVDIVAAASGNVFALSNTDSRIWRRQRGAGRARSFASVPGCASELDADRRHLWVVSTANCQGPATLYRFSQSGGKGQRRATFSDQVTDVRAAHGRVYVALRRVGGGGAPLAIYNPASGRLVETGLSGSDIGVLASNRRAVFLGGGVIGDQTGVVRRMRANGQSFDAERRLPRMILAMTATENYVVAIDRDGTIWVMNARTLEVEREITSGGVAIRPRAALAIGNSLYITSSDGGQQDRSAAVLVIDGWQPGSVPGVADDVDYSDDGDVDVRPVTVKKPKPRSCSGGRYYSRSRKACRCPSTKPNWNGKRCVIAKISLKCGKNYKLVNGECRVRQNCGKNAYRNVEGDCFCKAGFKLRNGRCKRVVRISCTKGRVYSANRNKCVCPSSAPHWYGGRCRPVRDCPGDSDLINGICQKVNEPAPQPKPKKPVTINDLKNNCNVLSAACKLGARAMCRKFQRQCQ